MLTYLCLLEPLDLGWMVQVEGWHQVSTGLGYLARHAWREERNLQEVSQQILETDVLTKLSSQSGCDGIRRRMREVGDMGKLQRGTCEV